MDRVEQKQRRFQKKGLKLADMVGATKTFFEKKKMAKGEFNLQKRAVAAPPRSKGKKFPKNRGIPFQPQSGQGLERGGTPVTAQKPVEPGSSPLIASHRPARPATMIIYVRGCKNRIPASNRRLGGQGPSTFKKRGGRRFSKKWSRDYRAHTEKGPGQVNPKENASQGKNPGTPHGKNPRHART